MSDLNALGESIKSALPVTGVTIARGELTVDVAAADILRTMAHLNTAGDFKILVDVCGVDWPQRAKRFDVVYHLLSLTRNVRIRVKAQVGEGEFAVTGKSMFKEEFVTCGGVRLSEVDFRTMESRLVPGLHFAGEVIDVDGITGGFNFQNAWTTGWLAGRAMAGRAE